jgi:hypothetical protein
MFLIFFIKENNEIKFVGKLTYFVADLTDTKTFERLFQCFVDAMTRQNVPLDLIIQQKGFRRIICEIENN